MIVEPQRTEILVVVADSRQKRNDFLRMSFHERPVSSPKASETQLALCHVGTIERGSYPARALGPNQLAATMQ